MWERAVRAFPLDATSLKTTDFQPPGLSHRLSKSLNEVVGPPGLEPGTKGLRVIQLTYRFTRTEAGKEIRRYWTSACTRCAIKARCTTGDYRRVSRWVHAKVLDRAQARLDQRPEVMRTRRATVEHPFGTIKSWMGATHFLTRTLPRVRTEMSLHVLAYNMKRAINLLGTRNIVAAIRA